MHGSITNVDKKKMRAIMESYPLVFIMDDVKAYISEYLLFSFLHKESKKSML